MALLSDQSKLEQLIVSTLALLRDSIEVVEDEAMRAAQAEQLTALRRVLDDADPIAGSRKVQLRPRARVALLTGLADCVARVRRAAERSPRLAATLPALTARQNTLLHIRDAWITQQVRGRPLRRPERDKPWHPPS